MELYQTESRRVKQHRECLCADRLAPWRISGRHLSLDPRITRYHVPLEDLTTRSGWLDWHIHLQSKVWASADVFEGLHVAAMLMGGAA